VSLVSTVQTKKRLPVLQLAKTIGAAVIAWYLAMLIFHDAIPVFAAIAALIVVQPSVNQSLGKALERSIGAVVGVTLAFGYGLLFGEHGWVVLVAITTGILIAWIMRLTPATASQIALTAMLALALGSITPAYALDRILQTILGALVGLLINASVAPPVALEPAHRAVSTLSADVAQVLEDLGAVLSRHTSYEVLNDVYLRARDLRAQFNSTQATVDRARESLRYTSLRNKRKHQKALDAEYELLSRLAILVTRVIGISRAVRDNYDDTLLEEPGVLAISDELKKAGHDLRLVVRDVGLPAVAAPHPATHEIPALTAPITVLRPSGSNWILVGFLMENLKLVRGQITGESTD
jgi:uncharacterized membrane protein YgaE (UPF0421/DUF939 family)